jgi:outer membrane lipoprotein-sorting protein
MKKTNMIIISIIAIMIISSGIGAYLFSQDAPIDAQEVVIKIDEMLSFEGDFSAKVNLVQKKPDEKDSVKTSKVYRNDEEEKFLMIFTSPVADAGNGYLFIDDNLWFYDSESREFIRKTMSESIGGTDTKSRDLEGSDLAETYDFEYIGEDTISRMECYVLYGKAKVADVAYPKTKLWIRKDNHLPIKREEYSVSDTLSQTIYFLNYIKVKNDNGKINYLANKVLVRDNLEKGKQTLVEFTDMSFSDLPDNIFTKAYLENQSN